MNSEAISQLISEGKSTREIADALDVPQTSLRRHMAKIGLKSSFNLYNFKQKHLCTCGELDPKNFYGKSKSQCKSCHGKEVLRKYKETKEKAIAMYGGRCVNCNYNRVPALEFHHIDGGLLKDPEFSGKFGWAWSRLLIELEKCVLVCSNCHKLLHAGELELPG